MRLRVALPFTVLVLVLGLVPPPARAAARGPATDPPIYIAFLWHMHQPIYWPYESVVATDANHRYAYSVTDIHDQRTGPYTTWPKDAVELGIAAGLPHFGAQVSFSGSLMENLDALAGAGDGDFASWTAPWTVVRGQTTSLGHPRLDLVGFGYHHPLMGLIETADLRRQIQAHRTRLLGTFGGAYSNGIFPPENAFTERMIPALQAEGLSWVLVDNIHFDRAAQHYPYSTAGNIVEPNAADARDPDPADWVALTGLWAPTRVSGGWGHRPHVVQYRDPASGQVVRMVAVPADRYMGNEDARGGFGALQYDAVLSQLEPYNTDPAHPLLVVLAHDGDNYGGGSDSYYHSNFQSFVSWLQANPSRFVCTTVEDYLQMFPPDTADVIHVENGAWSGADNGDPEFKKWLGDPDTSGYSPDRNSWAVVTAAKNVVLTADQVAPTATGTLEGWRYLLNAEASDYWYWDGAQGGVWDSHPARGCNQAVTAALPVAQSGADLTGPTLFVPQRTPYDPGGTQWGIQQPSDFTVWTYAYDLSGLAAVTLKYRLDDDGVLPVSSPANDTYAGGAGVGPWIAVACTSSDIASRTDPLPLLRAPRFSASVTGLSSQLVDYYVEAVDGHGNVSRSPIQHVWVGSSGSGGTTGVTWSPTSPTVTDSIRITVNGLTKPGKLHWGVNGWQLPIAAYRPAGSTLFGGTGPAVETPMNVVGANLTLTLGPFHDAGQSVTALDFVIHYDDGSYDNNSGQDYHVTVTGGTSTRTYVMDGALDSGVTKATSNAGVDLYVDWNGTDLYVATPAAPGAGKDVFVFVAGSRSSLVAAPWAKSGQVGQWAAYLANESTNNYSTWSDQQGAVAKAAGTYLEGTINLAGELGAVPGVVYVAVGRWATADGGVLQAQAPAGNGDANLDGAEYLAFTLTRAGVEPLGGGGLALAAAPEPCRDAAQLVFTLPHAASARLEVFDVHGRRIATPVRGTLGAGTHVARWDAAAVAAGVYFAVLEVDGVRLTRRVVHLP